MKGLHFAVLPDVQLGRELFAINFYDPWWLALCGIPQKEAVVGDEIDKRLERAVEFINSRPEVEFVVSIGDLTDSGTPEQFQKVREILDKLQKPFIPMIGNHDVWPYRREKGKKKVVWEAKRPLAVEEFEANFPHWKNSPCFENFKSVGGYLQNYAFTVRRVGFIIVDNNNRRKAPFGLPGQAGWAKMYAESKWWLLKQSFFWKDRTIIFSHAPIKRSLLRKLQRIVEKELINIAGHRHKRSKWQKGKVMQIVNNALYHEPYLLLVKVRKEGIETEYHRI